MEVERIHPLRNLRALIGGLLPRAGRIARNCRWKIRLQRQGVEGGRDAVILQRLPRIQNAGRCTIGFGFRVRAPLLAPQLETAASGTLAIGNHVFVNEGVIIAAVESVKIGDHVKFGDHCAVHDSNYHDVDAETPVKIAPVSIERNVWIGRNAVVLPGVTIGENSIVAAGAVVTASVPRNSIVAGNPAKVLDRTLQCPDGYRRN